MRAHLCVLGSALVLSGRANPYALVSHVHPHLTGAPGIGLLAAAEQAMTKATHEQRSKALIALADYLTALQAASRELERNPTNEPNLCFVRLAGSPRQTGVEII
jgi:hypothetical protein